MALLPQTIVDPLAQQREDESAAELQGLPLIGVVLGNGQAGGWPVTGSALPIRQPVQIWIGKVAKAVFTCSSARVAIARTLAMTRPPAVPARAGARSAASASTPSDAMAPGSMRKDALG